MKRIIVLSLLGLLLIGCGSTQQGPKPEVKKEVSSDELSRLQTQAANDSTNWKTHYNLAQALAASNEFEQAEQKYDRALVLNPLAFEAMLGKAELLKKMDEKTSAYSLYLKIIQTQGGEKYVPDIAKKMGKPFESRQITHGSHNNAAPDYSPDGKSIVFQSDRDGNMEIYTLALETNYETRLTDNPARDELPNYSPNGKIVAFNSTRNDSSSQAKAEKKRDIYVYHIENKAVARFTDNDEDDWYPSFNSKGDKLLFVSTRGDIRDIEFSKRWSDIYLADIKKKTITRVTENKYQIGCPCFSDDGKALIFNSNSDEKYHLFRMTLKNKQVEQLTSHDGNDAAPDVDQKSKRLVFFSDVAGNPDIFMLNLQTNQLLQLTSSSKEESYPSLSQNGKKIVYQAKTDDNYQIFEINLEKPLRKETLVKLIENRMAELAQQTAKK